MWLAGAERPSPYLGVWRRHRPPAGAAAAHPAARAGADRPRHAALPHRARGPHRLQRGAEAVVRRRDPGRHPAGRHRAGDLEAGPVLRPRLALRRVPRRPAGAFRRHERDRGLPGGACRPFAAGAAHPAGDADTAAPGSTGRGGHDLAVPPGRASGPGDPGRPSPAHPLAAAARAAARRPVARRAHDADGVRTWPSRTRWRRRCKPSPPSTTRVQALLFDPDRLAPTYPESMVQKAAAVQRVLRHSPT